MSRLLKLGHALIKHWGNKGLKTDSARLQGCCKSQKPPPRRGLLPWEKENSETEQVQQQLRKKPRPCRPPCCGQRVIQTQPDCQTMRRPLRNTYELVTHEETPCQPFPRQNIYDKTVCELRKFRKCFRFFGDESKCQNLAPDCRRIRKVYPMLEAVRKRTLTGCAVALPPQQPKPEPNPIKKEHEHEKGEEKQKQQYKRQ